MAQALALIVAQCERLVGMMPADVHQMTIVVYSPAGSSFDKALIRRAAGLFTAQYPERLAQLIIFPTGNLAWWFWGLVKPFLPAKTGSKVAILHRSEYYDRLQELIEPAQLWGLGAREPYQEQPFDWQREVRPRVGLAPLVLRPCRHYPVLTLWWAQPLLHRRWPRFDGQYRWRTRCTRAMARRRAPARSTKRPPFNQPCLG
jgi:hypothetical protein